MKIAVVNYDELNERKSDACVIENLVRFYDEATEDVRIKMGSEFRSTLEGLKSGMAADIVWIDTKDVMTRQLIPGRLIDNLPDILVSFAGAGFEWTTLTDGFGYNRIPCMQVHFDTKDTGVFGVLDKVMGINLFISR